MFKTPIAVLAAIAAVFIGSAQAQEVTGDTTNPPLFTSAPTILVRSPDPANLAKFYEALGFKIFSRSDTGTIFFHTEDDTVGLEILQMDPNTQPGGPKTTRTQQGVVAIFETTDQQEVVRRAKEAGSPLIERWNSSTRGHSIYYIADWENNIFGFAPRYHNPDLNVP